MALRNEISGVLWVTLVVLLTLLLVMHWGWAIALVFACVLLSAVLYAVTSVGIRVRSRLAHGAFKERWTWWVQGALVLVSIGCAVWVRAEVGILLLVCTMIGYLLGLYCARSFKNDD